MDLRCWKAAFDSPIWVWSGACKWSCFVRITDLIPSRLPRWTRFLLHFRDVILADSFHYPRPYIDHCLTCDPDNWCFSAIYIHLCVIAFPVGINRLFIDYKLFRREKICYMRTAWSWLVIMNSMSEAMLRDLLKICQMVFNWNIKDYIVY